VAIAAVILLSVLGGLALLRRRLLAGRQIDQAGTWDCGYSAPTARMQYTASSFAQPLMDVFRLFLRTHRVARPPRAFSRARPAWPPTRPTSSARSVSSGLSRRSLAHGPTAMAPAWRLQLYVLYLVLTLLVLLVWKLS